VKHVHWFKVDGKRMLCECKSTRARLPSSKYWLFEPRCEKHDIGGWYIETLSRRQQRGSKQTGTSTDWAGKHLGLLHPAMYIFGTAYKTLDTELSRRREEFLWGIAGSQECVQPHEKGQYPRTYQQRIIAELPLSLGCHLVETYGREQGDKQVYWTFMF
ncbi:hypothetical protein L7F22_063807, partial [Adiantum nelumboides]|nr:hypothetical protein [Adiantum nelumboides]